MDIVTSVYKPTWHAWIRRLDIGHLLAAGLLARLVVFALLPDQHFGDARLYVDTGHALATTGVMSSPIYMPLYPLWTWIWGGAWGVKLGDILVSTATIWLVFCATETVTMDRPAALIAAAIAAMYPHFLFYAVSGLTETLYAFLLVSSLLCLYRRRFAIGSALLVFTILVRPTLDLLAPILIAAFALVVHRASLREAALRIGQYACIYVALMSPWWVHNYLNYGTFVRLDLGDGVVLYSGNNPLNKSGGGVIGDENGSDVDLTPFNSIANPVKRNAELEHAAWKFIEQNPGRFLELAGIKFVRFWRLWPYAGEYDKPWIVATSLLSYGLVLSLTLFYLATQGRRNFRCLLPILLLAGYLTLVHMATIGSIRYRFPLEPFMIMLASAPAAQFMRRVLPRGEAIP
jgi:4-amino-4-deoxy-L-arabinose transferase-like glycosyltransferase